jgi:hypothetical protein
VSALTLAHSGLCTKPRFSSRMRAPHFVRVLLIREVDFISVPLTPFHLQRNGDPKSVTLS